MLIVSAKMARVPRNFSVLADFSVHKIWRGHNREWNLGSAEHKERYLSFLNEDLESAKFESGAVPQAITLMSNHAHEVFLVTKPEAFSSHMRRHHSRYGMYFNRRQERCGKVAQDRPKTCLIADDHHQMITVFYIHANPIRAGIVGDARDYFWSTHRLYAFGIKEPWMRNIQLPQWYLRLGKNAQQRQRQYRKLFALYLKSTGRQKQDFLHKLCFGPIPWMQQRTIALSKWRAEQRPP